MSFSQVKRKIREPLVSIIIPAYNAQQWIEEAVLSALNQTYPHIEVIVVDDSSKDSTSAIVEKIATNNRRLRLVKKPFNSGVSHTRNIGAQMSEGFYLQFLDADDVLAPTCVEEKLRIWEVAESRGIPVGGVLSVFATTGEEQGGVQAGVTSLGEFFVKEPLAHLCFLDGTQPRTVSGGSLFISREVFTKIGGYHPALSTSADWHLQSRLMLCGLAIVATYKPVYLYRLHPYQMHLDVALMEADMMLAVQMLRAEFAGTSLFNRRVARLCRARTHRMLAGSWWHYKHNPWKTAKHTLLWLMSLMI